MLKERWVASLSFPNIYVSDLGRVRSEKRVLKPFFSRRCWCVSIWREGRSHTRSVAALVAEAFLRLPNVLAAGRTHKILHTNGDRADCRAKNLLVVPRRKHSSIDYRRAQALRNDGVPLHMIERLTHIPVCHLKRRVGKAAKANGPLGGAEVRSQRQAMGEEE